MIKTNIETGELECFWRPPAEDIFADECDMETGETDANQKTLTIRKTKFLVPKSCFKKPESKEFRKDKCCMDVTDDNTYTLDPKEKVIHLKEDIIHGYNKTSHRLFLIPSLIFFFKIAAIVISFVEVFLHIWAHRKNSANKNPELYYRSPLHVASSQFCAICRNDKIMEQVGKLQDLRKKHINVNIKHVTRNIIT